MFTGFPSVLLLDENRDGVAALDRLTSACAAWLAPPHELGEAPGVPPQAFELCETIRRPFHHFSSEYILTYGTSSWSFHTPRTKSSPN